MRLVGFLLAGSILAACGDRAALERMATNVTCRADTDCAVVIDWQRAESYIVPASLEAQARYIVDRLPDEGRRLKCEVRVNRARCSAGRCVPADGMTVAVERRSPAVFDCSGALR